MKNDTTVLETREENGKIKQHSANQIRFTKNKFLKVQEKTGTI